MLCVITLKHPHIHVRALLKIPGRQPAPLSQGRNIPDVTAVASHSRTHVLGARTHLPEARDPLTARVLPHSAGTGQFQGQWSLSSGHQLGKVISSHRVASDGSVSGELMLPG